MKESNDKDSARDYLKLLYVLIPFGLLFSYHYFSDKNYEKMMREQGINTECVMVAYGEGRTGQRGPKNGYVNQFKYNIGDSTHYCYVFTSGKPLPYNLKLKVRYLIHKDGNVTIDFPDDYKEQYKEYGFNDYGY